MLELGYGSAGVASGLPAEAQRSCPTECILCVTECEQVQQ